MSPFVLAAGTQAENEQLPSDVRNKVQISPSTSTSTVPLLCSSSSSGEVRPVDVRVTATQGSIQLGNSKTIFLDITRLITNKSEHPLKQGGYCDIYVAKLKDKGNVALKKIRDLGSSGKWKKCFRYEAEIWIRLNHPNVLQFFGIYQDGPYMYMVSPWQDNGYMTVYLAIHPEVDHLHFLTQVADALSFLHNHNPPIIHGDVKGQNVLVSRTGDALLCDFGLSMILSDIAMSGVPSGVENGTSVRWSAPELFFGGSKSKASDVYSFSLLIIEAFTISPPYPEYCFDGGVIKAIYDGIRPSNPFTSNTIEETRLWCLLQRCWDADKQIRPTMDVVHWVMKSIRVKAEHLGAIDSPFLLDPFVTRLMQGRSRSYWDSAMTYVKTWIPRVMSHQLGNIPRLELGVDALVVTNVSELLMPAIPGVNQPVGKINHNYIEDTSLEELMYPRFH